MANPGCYATSVILALAPLLAADVIDREKGIISDSKSGVSGAGKEATARTHFVSVADNLSAYSVFAHRHVGEILEQLKLDDGELIFTPHLLPIPPGNSFDDLCAPEARDEARGSGVMLSRFLFRANPGSECSRHRSFRRSSFRCTQIIAISVFAWRRMDAGWFSYRVWTTS